ncbi:Rox3-domain-containing protein [Stipitochalara longipes BDJ]|nr:Rox3-domain-containing protein [Stipitochalara longipes BDJ]
MPSDHPHTPQSPSTASFSAADHPRKQSTSPRTSHSLPTPAHSINGSMSSNSDIALEIVHDEVSNKRKRDVGDTGDRDQKKVHVEDSRASIDDLHLDVGEKYLLCRTPHPARLPDLKQDLYALYTLEDLAKSVARTNPDGSKAVKLRKTYKNHIKEHGVSGAFDSVKKEMDAPDTLMAMMLAPEEEWDAQYTRGKEVGKGLPENVMASMGKAFTMAKGIIPKTTWNASVLGELNVPAQTESKVLQNGSKTPIPQNPSIARTAKSDAARPKRSVKKRTYGDSSYEGYGEGYVDDDAQETGYSTGDGEDRGGSRKRPKKTTQSHSFQNPPMRQNSYGPGMVGA